MGDEVLRIWGSNIKGRRNLLAPDGSLRATADAPRMSQADLGHLLDPPVAQSTIARWERGLMEPRRHYKAQIANVLMSDVSMIFPMTRAS